MSIWVKVSKALPSSSGYLRHSEQKYVVRYKTTTNSLSHSEESSSIKTNWVKTTKKDSLKHWGTRGMKWGHRRYQNTDGSLTPLGEIHYGVGTKKERRKAEKDYVRTKEAEDKVFAKTLKADQKAKRDQQKAEDKQKKNEEKQLRDEERAKEKRERKVKREIEKEEKAVKKAEDKQKEAEEMKKLKEELLAKKNKSDEDGKEPSSAKNEEKDDSSKKQEKSKNESENSKTENLTESVRNALSSKDYTNLETAFNKGGQNFEKNASLVGMLDQARRNNRVNKAIGKRELKKPISEMSDKEINDTINRWAQEERLAQMTVGRKSQAAENVQTALKVMGNVTSTVGGAMGIASAIREIYERR